MTPGAFLRGVLGWGVGVGRWEMSSRQVSVSDSRRLLAGALASDDRVGLGLFGATALAEKVAAVDAETYTPKAIHRERASRGSCVSGVGGDSGEGDDGNAAEDGLLGGPDVADWVAHRAQCRC